MQLIKALIFLLALVAYLTDARAIHPLVPDEELANDEEVVARTICWYCGTGPEVYQANAWVIRNLVDKHLARDNTPRVVCIRYFGMWQNYRGRVNSTQIPSSHHAKTRADYPMCLNLAKQVIQDRMNAKDPTKGALHSRKNTPEIRHQHSRGVSIGECWYY